MDEITLEVETVTPLFIAGADQRNIENEGLRAPSLRGLLRWWFRAALGGVMFSSGSLNVKEIKKEEERIWGTTNMQSKVAISTSPINVSTQLFRDRTYLAYGVSGRDYIKGKFRMNIRFRPTICEEDKKKIVATFWLLLNLGNIGSKSRKGFGSLRITNCTTICDIEFKNPNDVNELGKYIESNIKSCLETLGWDGSTTASTDLPPFSILAPNFWKMKILNSVYSSEIEAIKGIGEKIRQYREDIGNPSARRTRRGFPYWVTKDYNAVKGIYTHTSTRTPSGSIFGLPHQFQFQSLRPPRKAIVKGIEHDRRASPLHIKIWRLDEDKFVVGLQLFKSLFLPENKLRISDLRNPSIRVDVDLPSYDYLENFLNRLTGRWITL